MARRPHSVTRAGARGGPAPGVDVSGRSQHFGQTLAVVGTPAAGKTTVARTIAAMTGGRYLSMAELNRVARRDGWLDADQFAAIDRPDPHDDVAVLTAALERHALADLGSLVVLDDVVTSAASLGTFARCGPDHRVRLQVVELDAPDLALLERTRRWFCLFCQPDPDGEPHQPAPVEVGRASGCSSCGRPLSIRSRDESMAFLRRLSIYRQQAGELMAVAARHSIRWTRIDATQAAQQCADLAITAIGGPTRRQAPPGRPPAPRSASP